MRFRVFVLFQAEEGGCEPKHSFAADSKGSVGHNVVMYWHSLKPLPGGVGARGTGAQRESGGRGVDVDVEGVVAGSVAGKHHCLSSKYGILPQ